uniref:MIT domain-containing protein n=1 Tax=Cuerna arida TaxID=1464854 RepID=A0A1B6EP20_9HEMI
METAALSLLKRAVEMDEKKRYTEALVCYQEGIQMLINCMRSFSDTVKRQHFREKVEMYIGRAEHLKRQIEDEKSRGVYHEQIVIEHNSTGHSYLSVFGRFLDSEVKEVVIEDPYIRYFHQCQNLLRLCELLVKSCPNLRTIQLLTSQDNSCDQSKSLEKLKSELSSRHVSLKIQFSTTLHDRQIKLSNGWIIKIGRGLDYFKPPESKFSMGYYDLDLRPCHETTVDIFHEKDVRMTHS